ncbi:hypothetical protein HCN44_002500 [Aphidius gifuensis]|uniref:Glycosyl transferase CAP10 domain-containing protein n=1 Tax=Aphidius gifuensis TaxID=684658 RepID=A0A835CUB1_APHGI|nr:O-glucosyltransferase rumi homolog [Aphidius gifuensis]KAF7996854.1 hypothetical protein HCN44_002500 [Aphidius gifuensis]
MDKLIILLLFLTLLLNPIKSNDSQCSIDSTESCLQKNVKTSSKLSIKDIDNKYKKFYEAINNAEDNYQECELKKCGCFKNVINNDLKTFKKDGISEKLIEQSRQRGTIYQIINGSLYRSKDCMFPSRCAGVEYFIKKIINNMTNIEFVLNTRDYPQSNKIFGQSLPIFSFSKTLEYFDIMYPAWSFWEGGPAISLYPRGLGRWDQHRKSLNNAADNNEWNNKIDKAFFRGSRTSDERDNLVYLSRNKPDLVDAQYTKNQAWKSDKDTLGRPPSSEVSLEDHCKYKYLFNYRGVAASFRHKHLFLCNSLVFHVGDEWLEFYYESMKPWIHYIPVEKNASQDELEDLITFAKENYSISKKIAQRGRDFIWYKLRMADVTCYWKSLLKKYSKLLTYQVKLRPDLIKLT